MMGLRIRRPSLLMLTALTVTVSTVAHGVGAISAVSPAPVEISTRLGVAIKQDLAAHEQASAGRDRALDLREQLAKAAEQRIKADLLARQVKPVTKTSTASRVAGAKPESDQFDDLARIYQAMKPASAAVVFEQLDMDVQMQVAQRMRERSTALILATMTSKGAAELTMALARKDPVKAKITARGS